MTKILGLIFLLSNIPYVLTYSSGAPKSVAACHNRRPHHGKEPQKTNSPYVITVNTTSPGYDDLIQVTIKGQDANTRLRGFIIQAIPVANRRDTENPRPIGTFFTDSSKILNCFHGNDTATHSDNRDKSSVELLYKLSTSIEYRPFYFRATVVKGYSTFWENVASEQLTTPDFGQSPADEWTEKVIDTAVSLTEGKTQWNTNIQERLNRGYSGMINNRGQFKTRNIFRNLPFTRRQVHQNQTDSNSLYLSEKNLESLSSKGLVTELLKGDLRSALVLKKKIAVNNNAIDKQWPTF